MTDGLEKLMGFQRVTVSETDRALVLHKGRFDTILTPGSHLLRDAQNRQIEMHSLTKGLFASAYEQALFRARPDLAAQHLTEYRAGDGEVLVISRDGRPFQVVTSGGRLVVWTEAGPWTAEAVTLPADHAVPTDLAFRLERAGLIGSLFMVEVPEGHVGILYINGVQTGMLPMGTHRFWRGGGAVAVKRVETRWATHDVTGQEILTRDRVTLRVNLSADYRVTDPLAAVGRVKDFAEALHRALQLAFRRTLGAVTLDELLADKVSVDAGAAAAVRAEMAEVGVEVGQIALKDVILPGEMRDILNRVVQAQKEAEANVIRRRDEAEATRALLNAAKVMADNPVMLRLKELEALQQIAGKVERLTVHNGTGGLLSDIVRLRE